MRKHEAWIQRAIAVGCLMGTLPAAAQTISPAPSPVVLDARSATRLALNQTHPEYPPVAKHNYIQGHVRLQIRVTREGRVREAHIVFGHPFLAAAALGAVHHWRYRPYVTPSGPVEFQTLVEVNFTLRSKKVEQVPQQPEQDLKRQVHPPVILEQPPRPEGWPSVPLRVLVDDKGRVIDSQSEGGQAAQFEAARKSLEHWTFRPARWGTLPVPWYLDVDVPIEDSTLRPGASDPGNR